MLQLMSADVRVSCHTGKPLSKWLVGHRMGKNEDPNERRAVFVVRPCPPSSPRGPLLHPGVAFTDAPPPTQPIYMLRLSIYFSLPCINHAVRGGGRRVHMSLRPDYVLLCKSR